MYCGWLCRIPLKSEACAIATIYNGLCDESYSCRWFLQEIYICSGCWYIFKILLATVKQSFNGCDAVHIEMLQNVSCMLICGITCYLMGLGRCKAPSLPMVGPKLHLSCT